MKFKSKVHIQWNQPRRCKFCGCQFTPKRPQDEQQMFCTSPHKDAYYATGSMPFPKLIDRLKKEILREFGTELREEFREQIDEHVHEAIAAALREQRKVFDAELRQLYANRDDTSQAESNQTTSEFNTQPSGAGTDPAIEAPASGSRTGNEAAGATKPPSVRRNSRAGEAVGTQPGVSA